MWKLIPKVNYCPITYAIIRMATATLEYDHLSLEEKRMRFKFELKEYYDKFSGKSELLVLRIHEIDFNKNIIQQLVTPFVLSAGFSTCLVILQ